MNNTFLDALEAAHRARTGVFCYVATLRIRPNTWGLSIVERNVDGHFPVSEDYFLGPQEAAQREAATLNSSRLGLTEREAARIVASSMTGGCR